MPQVEPHARHAAGAQHGRAVGQHGARAFPHLHAARQAGRAGKPVVQHLVERLHGAGVDGVGPPADLGRAGHAHALAQARDGDLVALVHHAAARADDGLGHVRADRVAVYRTQRHVQAQRRQPGGRLHAGAQHHGVEALAAAVPLQRGGRRGAGRVHRGVEAKLRAQRLRGVAQDDGELAAVAHFVLRQVDGTEQRGVGLERGLDGARLLAADFVKHHAGLAQHRQPRLHDALLLLAAQQHQVTLAALEFVFHARGHLVQALAAVESQALQLRAVGGVGAGIAGAQPAAHPAQVGHGQRPRHAHRGVARQQVADDLARHARRGPGRDVAGRQHAGVGKAGALGHAGVALEYGDLVAIKGQFVRGSDADDAGAEDGDVHGAAGRGFARAKILGFCSSLGTSPGAAKQIANRPSRGVAPA